MSDYLSSLAARSLRREPACEPRRAQMFEPRQETLGTPLADEASAAELPGEETFESITTQTPVTTAAPISRAPAVYEGDEPGPDSYASPQQTDSPTTPRPSHTTRPLSTPPDTLQIPEPLETQSPLQTPALPSQTSHTRTSAEHPPHSTQPVEFVRETTPTLVARLAQTQADTHEPQPHAPVSPPTANASTEATAEPPAPHAPRDVMLIPQTPPVTHPSSTDVQSEDVTDSSRPLVPSLRSSSRGATQIPPPADSEEMLRARPSTPSVKTSSASPSREPFATVEEPGEAIRPDASARARRADVVDEESRERTTPVVRRAAVEPRAGRLESEGQTTVVELEVVPQSSTSKRSQTAEAPTRLDSESLSDGVLEPRKSQASTVAATTATEVRPIAEVSPVTEVRPVAAQPPAVNARAVALPTTGEHVGPGRGARLNGIQATQRDEATQPPTIEVTIGRIEVRAVTPPAAPQPQRARQTPPKMSLDDYLRGQNGGRT